MKPWVTLFFVMTASSIHAQSDEEIMPLEDRIGQHWNSVKLAYGINEECTGLSLRNEFTITREGANKTISTTTMINLVLANSPRSQLIATPPVRLSHELYEVIVEGFRGHLKTARKELNVEESLTAYPESISYDEITKRMAERGEIAGAKEKGYIVVIFNPGAKQQKYTDAFVKPASLESFVKWLDSYRRYAAPQYVK